MNADFVPQDLLLYKSNTPLNHDSLIPHLSTVLTNHHSNILSYIVCDSQVH